MGKGKGWWGQRYRHKLAAMKGWRQRRTISRSLKRYHKEHLEDGHKMERDVQIRAKATYPTSDKAAIRRWKQDPARSDILGVDTDLWRRLKAPQVKARAIYRKSKDRVQKVVQDFKVEKKRIQASKVSQKEKKKRVKQEADRTIRKVAAEHDAAEKISEDAKKEQRKAITKYVKPWKRERKRRAAMVARSLASDMITADALIQRAERKGWDYDTVNWDELQGKDLMYMDRLNRLERQTGETQTRMEEEGEIDWQIEKYESEYQEFVKAEAQKVAEKGKTKIPKDMAMQKDFSGGGRMEFVVQKEKKGLVKPRYQESKVKPREKPKEQAILTSKEDLAKSRLEKGQMSLDEKAIKWNRETIVRVKAEALAETEMYGGQRYYSSFDKAKTYGKKVERENPDWIVRTIRVGDRGSVIVLADDRADIEVFYGNYAYRETAYERQRPASPKALSKNPGNPGEKQTLFFDPKYKKYADIVKMDTPANAKVSVVRLEKEVYQAKSPEKFIRIRRVAVATANRAEATAKNKRLSLEQRKEAREVAKIYRDFADRLPVIVRDPTTKDIKGVKMPKKAEVTSKNKRLSPEQRYLDRA